MEALGCGFEDPGVVEDVREFGFEWGWFGWGERSLWGSYLGGAHVNEDSESKSSGDCVCGVLFVWLTRRR